MLLYRCKQTKGVDRVDLNKLLQDLSQTKEEIQKLDYVTNSETSLQELKNLLEIKCKTISKEFKKQVDNISLLINNLQFEKKVSGEIRTYEIYTDGGARGNGNEDCVCAWAYHMITPHFPLPQDNAKAGIGATNQRMELIAILQALNAVPVEDRSKFEVNLYSDSAYCINTLNDYIHRWVANNWTKSKGEIAHLDAWKQVYSLMTTFTNLNFIKVKGHSSNTGNNNVDKLVNKAMDELEEKLASDESV